MRLHPSRTLACCLFTQNSKRDLRTRAAPPSIAAGRLDIVKRRENIRRTAARNILATLFAAAILTVIPSSGRAQDGAQAIDATIGSDRLRALIDEALARSPVVLAARSHWQATNEGANPGVDAARSAGVAPAFHGWKSATVFRLRKQRFLLHRLRRLAGHPGSRQAPLAEVRGGKRRRLRQASLRSCRSVQSRKRSKRFISSCSITRRRWRFSTAIRTSCGKFSRLRKPGIAWGRVCSRT